MAIFSNNYVRNSYAVVKEASLSSAADIVMEASETASNLISALYVSDVVIESKVLFEGANPQVLVEATIKEIYKKFIDALVKLKNKIVAWFKRLWENIKARFTRNKNFVKKYKSKILKAIASNNDISLKGYEYGVSDVRNAFSRIVATSTSFLSGKYTNENAKDDIADTFQDIVHAGGTSVGDIKSGLMAVGKPNSKVEIKMTSALVNKLIAEVESESSVLKEIEKSKTDCIKAIDAVIKTAQKESNKNDEESGSKAQSQIAALNYVSSVVTACATVTAKLVEMNNKQASSLLKGVFLKRKESTEMIADEITDPEIPDAEIDELVESAIETVGQDNVGTPVADEDVTDVMDDTMDDTVVSTDPEDAAETDSVLAEAFSALGI